MHPEDLKSRKALIEEARLPTMGLVVLGHLRTYSCNASILDLASSRILLVPNRTNASAKIGEFVTLCTDGVALEGDWGGSEVDLVEVVVSS
jgi:hypothetical protein